MGGVLKPAHSFNIHDSDSKRNTECVRGTYLLWTLDLIYSHCFKFYSGCMKINGELTDTATPHWRKKLYSNNTVTVKISIVFRKSFFKLFYAVFYSFSLIMKIINNWIHWMKIMGHRTYFFLIRSIRSIRGSFMNKFMSIGLISRFQYEMQYNIVNL